MNPKLNTLAIKEGFLSIIINTLLFGIKYWAGITTGSIAVIADAWHTLSDSLTSLIVILGAKASSKPRDKEHPFGHGRAELIASIIIGVLLGVVGFNFLTESIEKLRSGETARFSRMIIYVFAASTVIKEGIAQYSFWAGKKTGSRALKADGWHHRSDAIASLLILTGAFLGREIWWIDGALGIAVALLILYASFEIIQGGANPLMGETPKKDLQDKIEAIGKRVSKEPLSVHHLHLHRYGDHQEITFHIRLNKTMDLLSAHRVANSMEEAIREELFIESTIHIEPD